MGDGATAQDYARRALTLLEEVAAEEPAARITRRELAIGYIQVGDLLWYAGDMTGALANYRKALEIRQALLSADPANVQARRDFAVVSGQIGLTLARTGVRQDALDQLRRATEMFRQLATDDPSNAIARRDLSKTHQVAGEALLALGDAAGALERFEQGIAVAEPLAAASPGSAVAQRDLATRYFHAGAAHESLATASGASSSTAAARLEHWRAAHERYEQSQRAWLAIQRRMPQVGAAGANRRSHDRDRACRIGARAEDRVVSATRPAARLVVGGRDDQREFVLDGDHVLVGRAAACDIVLGDETVSRSHARVERRDGAFVVEDLGTPNGTFVNGTRVERMTLSPADIITVGKSTLRFEAGEPAPAPNVTTIATEAELDTVLSEETVTVRLHNSSTPVLVAHVAGRTWEVPLSGDALTIGRQPSSDIVIQTPSASRMHARVERRGETVVIRDLDTSNGTWVNGERVTERVLVDGATIRIGDARLVFKAGIASAEQTLAELTATDREVLSPVVIVPGFMGSELWNGNEQIWPNLKTLFVRPEPLAISDSRLTLEPRRIVHQVVIVPNLIKLDKYIRLGNYLEEGLGYERGKNLLEFAYDWRQDNRVSARQLAAAIDQWQQQSSDAARPITIIAHSMGSLVSRYYIEHLGGKEKVERLIFLGGPHHGVPKAISALVFGPKSLPFGQRGRAAAGGGRDVPRHLSAPSDVFVHGVTRRASGSTCWPTRCGSPSANGRCCGTRGKFRKEFGTRSSVPAVCIFGYGIETITGVSVHRGSERQWEKVKLSMRRGGDDMVPEAERGAQGRGDPSR